jgi:hypothetical protein
MQRVMGVFFSPGETFADIARVPTWVVPIILLTILSFGVSVVMNQRVDWRSIVEKQASQNPRFEQLSAEQKTQQLDMGTKFAPYVTYAIGLCGPILLTLIVGLIYFGAFNLFMGAGLKFMTAFAITAHAWVVRSVAAVLAIIVIFLKRPGDVDPEHLLAADLGAFLSNEAPKPLMKLATSLDIFSIWLLVMLAIGFAAANPKKISKTAAYSVVFGVWAVVVLVKVIWATF